MDVEHSQLELNLLGPLSIRLNGAPVRISAPQQRKLISLLALHAGQVVTGSMLVEELWGTRPPKSHATTLQTYVLQLRNAFAAADSGNLEARRILGTRPCGYILEKDPCVTDIEVFEHHAAAGRAAAAAGDYLKASQELDRALGMWAGPALVDVKLGTVLQVEAASLEESRLGALERRLEVDLVLGRHADLLGELTRLSARNPMNENLCAFLMTALYRTCHVGRALQAFRRLRTVLNEELGVEPCPRLQHLHELILTVDPVLDRGPLPWSELGARDGLADPAPSTYYRAR